MKKVAWSTRVFVAGLGVAAASTGCGGSSESDLTGPGGPGAGGAGGGGAAGAAAMGGSANGGASGKGGTTGLGGKAGAGAGGGAGGAPTGGASGKGGNGGTGAGGAGTSSGGTSGTGAAGSGAGAGAAGKGGSGTAGAGAAGAGTAGTAGSGTAGTAGAGTAGTAGSGAAGSSAAGTGGAAGAAGSSAAGTGGAAGAGTGGSGASGTAGAGGIGGGGMAGAAGKAGSGGAPGCAPALSACTTPSSTKGLCESGLCVDCKDPADDAACTAAYGAPTLCLAGSCTAGNCRVDADCAVAVDVCTQHQCGPCDAVGTTFFVDTVAGDDAKATGSGTAAGSANGACSFKTVTAALKAINAKGTAAATILEVLGPASVHVGEVFPLAIPGNTTVTASGGAVKVLVPAGQTGFTMSKPVSKIDGASVGITIDGQGAGLGASPQRGIVAAPGSDLTDVLTNVTVQGFANQAIAVSGGGGLTVRAGVTVTTSGQAPGPGGVGIYAVAIGDGNALFDTDIAANEAPFLIEANKGGGVAINGLSVVTMTGVPGATVGSGSVVVANNAGPGMQSAAFGSGSVALKGVVFFQNGLGSGGASFSGVRVMAGSTFSMYESVSLANGAHGVHVLPNPNSGLGPYAGIDLGGGNGSGLNVFQDVQNKNKLVGICLDASNQNGQTLSAKGNLFSASDCSMQAAVLKNGTACAKNGDVGVVQAALGLNKIDVTMCTYP